MVVEPLVNKVLVDGVQDHLGYGSVPFSIIVVHSSGSAQKVLLLLYGHVVGRLRPFGSSVVWHFHDNVLGADVEDVGECSLVRFFGLLVGLVRGHVAGTA